MAEDSYDDVVGDLTTLRRMLQPAVPSAGLTTAVMDRVDGLPAADRQVNAWTRMWPQAKRRLTGTFESRRRRVALVVGAVLLGLLATPSVRAAVADWFGFGGVRVEPGSAAPAEASPPPEVMPGSSLSETADEVGFILSVPEELGAPDGVELSPDKRLVSMSWATDEDGVIRLDQFDARLDFSVLKLSPGVMYAAVGGTDALWFEEPHEVVLLEPDGSRRTETARLAGHTLIWLDDATTLRLEGDLSIHRAVEIAESTTTVE